MGTLFPGLFVALTLVMWLGSLGAVVDLSASDGDRKATLAVGAGVWAVATALIGFFFGGCATSRLTAG